jgi:hypothetical protein
MKNKFINKSYLVILKMLLALFLMKIRKVLTNIYWNKNRIKKYRICSKKQRTNQMLNLLNKINKFSNK